MSERPEPDLDQVREAMREHDEQSEDPPEHVVRKDDDSEDGADETP
jgi:hypothetical protein